VWLASRSVVPAETEAPRATFAGHSGLDDGFHPDESDGIAGRTGWAAAGGLLRPFAGAFVLELHLVRVS